MLQVLPGARQVRTVVSAPAAAAAAAHHSLVAGGERILVFGLERLEDIHAHVREFQKRAAQDGWRTYVRTGRSVHVRKDDAIAAVRFHHYIDRDEPFDADTIVMCIKHRKFSCYLRCTPCDRR